MGKILFIDVDGTLVDSCHNLRERTNEALRRAARMGHRIVISSGRCVDGIRDISRQFDFPYCLSTLNGAYVVDENGAVVSENPFPPEDAILAADLIAKYSMGHLYFTGPCWGSGNSADYELEYSVVRTAGIHDSLDEVVRTRTVHKILACGDQRLDSSRAFLEEIRMRLDNYMIMPSSPIYIEINTPGTSKGSAVTRLCSLFGIPLADSLAFGDWDNDISMFQAAGHAVCMANGSASARAQADEIAPSNDEDGLAVWIEDNLIL